MHRHLCDVKRHKEKRRFFVLLCERNSYNKTTTAINMIGKLKMLDEMKIIKWFGFTLCGYYQLMRI